MKLLWFWITFGLTLVIFAYATTNAWMLLAAYVCFMSAGICVTSRAEQRLRRDEWVWMRGDGN